LILQKIYRHGNNSEDSPESESQEEEEEGGEEEEEQEEKPPKNKATRSGRTITPNKMIGCVKKGKYSCTTEEKMKKINKKTGMK